MEDRSDEVAELMAENAKLRAEVEGLKKCILDGAIPSMKAIEEQRDAALLQVEELRKALKFYAEGCDNCCGEQTFMECECATARRALAEKPKAASV